jgi:hypothetical protein
MDTGTNNHVSWTLETKCNGGWPWGKETTDHNVNKSMIENFDKCYEKQKRF